MDSILNQSCQNFEILIIDDASEKPLTSFADSRIRIHRNPTNLGPGPSRNIGMEMAKGNFVVFLDSDDYWHPDFLKLTKQALISDTNAVMAYANGTDVDAREKPLGIRRNKIKTPEHILPDILSRNRHWGTGACLWRKKDIDYVRWIATRSWEDYAFDIDVALKNNRIIGIEEQLVFYDVSGSDKLSARKPKDIFNDKIRSVKYIFKNLYDSEFQKDSKIRRSVSYILLMLLMEYYQQKINNPSISRYLKQEFKRWNGFVINLGVSGILMAPGKIKINGIDYLTRIYRRLRS